MKWRSTCKFPRKKLYLRMKKYGLSKEHYKF